MCVIESVRIMPFGDRKEQYSVETHEGARTNQQGDVPFTLKKKKVWILAKSDWPLIVSGHQDAFFKGMTYICGLGHTPVT